MKNILKRSIELFAVFVLFSVLFIWINRSIPNPRLKDSLYSYSLIRKDKNLLELNNNICLQIAIYDKHAPFIIDYGIIGNGVSAQKRIYIPEFSILTKTFYGETDSFVLNEDSTLISCLNYRDKSLIYELLIKDKSHLISEEQFQNILAAKNVFVK